MKRSILAVVAALAALAPCANPAAFAAAPPVEASRSEAAADSLLARAWRDRISDIQVRGRGVVERILPDDDEGSRHQRFILRLASGQTLLVAHNIDLAPRIETLQAGDEVHFFGEYEWNEKGGVIHWTHHDPAGKHVGGWLRHDGELYR